MSTIFISYRRDDTAPYAGRIYDRLTAHFGVGQVFMDIDQIEAGEDFVEVIQRKVSACEIAIVLIGRHWLNSQDAAGRRRLDDPEDFVRLEVAASLDRKVRVVPVLVGGAAMPRMKDLPEAIATLARRNAIEVSDARFHSDCDRLIESLAKRPRAVAPQPDAVSATTPEAGAQSAEGRADPPPAQPAHSRNTVGSGKGWAIATAATLGVAVLAFMGLRGTNTAPPPVPVLQAPPVVEAPSTNISGDTGRRAAPGLFGALGSENSVDQFLLEAQQRETLKLTERAKAGSAEAQFELGVMHETGTPNDLVLAEYWYSLAAIQRYPLAKEGAADAKTLLLRGNAEPDAQIVQRQLSRQIARMQLSTERLGKDSAIKHIKP